MTDEQALLEQLTRELSNFEEIAHYLVPSADEVPIIPGVEVAGLTLPLNGLVGGDHVIYVDFNRRFDIDARIVRAEREHAFELAANLRACRDTAGVAVLDVAGHHVTDALLAAMLHQSFLLGSLYELDAAGRITSRLFENLNTRFYESLGDNKFITMIYGEILAGARFRFISAGHPMPLIFSSRHDRFMSIDASAYVSCPPLGLMPSLDDIDRGQEDSPLGFKQRYETNEWVLMGDGDMLVLHTDGFLEHGPDDRGAFLRRLEETMRDVKHLTVGAIVSRIEAEVRAAGPQTDDITFVVIKRT